MECFAAIKSSVSPSVNKQLLCWPRVLWRLLSTCRPRRALARLTHSVCMARSDVKVPLASVWILLSYSDSSERFCRSWKALARTQWILLALSSLGRMEVQRAEEERKEGRREKGGKQPVRVSHSLCIPVEKTAQVQSLLQGHDFFTEWEC